MEPRIDLLTLQMNLPYYNLKEKLGRKVEIDWRAEWERFDAKKLFDFDPAEHSGSGAGVHAKTPGRADGRQSGGHFRSDPVSGRVVRLSHYARPRPLPRPLPRLRPWAKRIFSAMN